MQSEDVDPPAFRGQPASPDYPQQEPVVPVVAAYERARKREIASYLSAASLPVDEYRKHEGEPPSLAPPALCRDPALTALCQLAALRTGTDRSFLSLINGAHQYIVAEATRSHSLIKPDTYKDEADSIYLGVQKLDLYWGVCPNTMKVFTDENGSMEINTSNIYANRTRYIIKDFQEDEHYRTCPYVSGFPHMRSYAEVPLISPLGYCIGSICVVDNKLRDFGDETVEILDEIASVIMAHLELVRIKHNRVRSEQLVKGLAQFIEHGSTRPHDIEDESTSKHATGPALDATEAAESAGSKRSENVRPVQELETREATLDTQSSCAQPEAERSSIDYVVTTQCSTESSMSPCDTTSPETPLTTPPHHQDQNPFNHAFRTSPRELSGEVASPGSSNPFPKPRDPNERYATSIVSSEVREAFARAAELIRTSMGLEGVSFVDACPSSFASRSNQTARADRSGNLFPKDSLNELENSNEEALSPTAVLARSLREPAKYSFQTESSQLPELHLQRLIKRYPQGHIFSADEAGPIEEQYGPGKKFKAGSSHQHARQRSQSRADTEQLFRWLPNARSFMFLPLWHFQRECWFAAIFAWTEDFTQAFDINDFTYLRAFGNSVMAEVDRFEALAVSRAKSDFISSVSHELRSPLHGILASTELLREALGEESEHRSLLDMTDSCGQILLDTMNHLLDFAKINNLAKPKSSRQVPSDSHEQHSSHTSQVASKLGVATPTDLSRLVQDVAEVIYVGYSSKVAFQADISYESSMSSPARAVPSQEKPVLVTIDVERRANWVLNIEVGAWKRIVMNIFGNAVKYTRSGTIDIGLQIVTQPDRVGIKKPHICFSVKDTGIGISSEYLKYHLYTPFAQENSLSPGTGLGLSIVQQIVKSLCGRLEIESKVGVGTSVKVYVPAEPGIQPVNDDQMAVLDPEHQLAGKTIYVYQPDDYPDHHRVSLEAQSANVNRYRAVQRAVGTIATTWLDMQTANGSNSSTVEADFYVVDWSILGDYCNGDSLQLPFSANKSTLILSYQPESNLIGTQKNVVFMRHPIGPRKLTSALLDALAMRKRGRDIDRIDPTPSPPSPRSTNSVPMSEASPAVNETSHPTITSPASSAKANAVADAVASAERSCRKPHLLLVDDNPINLKLLITLAKRLGCTYAAASDGREAVTLFMSSCTSVPTSLTTSPTMHSTPFATRHFDLVFMDLNMPILSGFEAAREIRKCERERGLRPAKIVALTGLGDDVSKQEAFASGMELFFMKPVRLADVRALLKAAEEDTDGAEGSSVDVLVVAGNGSSCG